MSPWILFGECCFFVVVVVFQHRAKKSIESPRQIRGYRVCRVAFVVVLVVVVVFIVVFNGECFFRCFADIDEELARIQAAKKRLAEGGADGGVPLATGEHTPYMDRQLYNSTSKNKFAGYVTSIPASDDVDADVSAEADEAGFSGGKKIT